MFYDILTPYFSGVYFCRMVFKCGHSMRFWK